MDLRLRDVRLGQEAVQPNDDHRRPLAMKTVPGPAVGEWGVEVVAQGHDATLGRIGG